jgi:hypothetical protein
VVGLDRQPVLSRWAPRDAEIERNSRLPLYERWCDPAPLRVQADAAQSTAAN